MSLFAQLGFCTHGSMHFCRMEFQCVHTSKRKEMETHLVFPRISIKLIGVFQKVAVIFVRFYYYPSFNQAFKEKKRDFKKLIPTAQ